MIDEQDPEGLLKDLPNRCEDCGKKISKEFKKCYLCYLKYKGEKE